MGFIRKGGPRFQGLPREVPTRAPFHGSRAAELLGASRGLQGPAAYGAGRSAVRVSEHVERELIPGKQSENHRRTSGRGTRRPVDSARPAPGAGEGAPTRVARPGGGRPLQVQLPPAPAATGRPAPCGCSRVSRGFSRQGSLPGRVNPWNGEWKELHGGGVSVRFVFTLTSPSVALPSGGVLDCFLKTPGPGLRGLRAH